MRHKVAGRKLSRPTGHRMSLYYNLTTELLWHERIVTTVTKAKEVRGMADKVITLARKAVCIPGGRLWYWSMTRRW